MNRARFRELSRDVIAVLGAASGLTGPLRRHRGHLVVVTFHRILPDSLRDQYPYPNLVVTPEELDWLLGTLARGYTLGPLGELHARHVAGECSAKPFMAVTFDDGQLDNFVHARPVLERHGVRASFFVPVNAIDEAEALWHDQLGFAVLALRRAGCAEPEPLALVDAAKRLSPAERAELVRHWVDRARTVVPAWAGMMSWEQVRTLCADGHEIGSHSMSHALLPQCDERTLRVEAACSKARIEGELGVRVDSFCYPNGDWDRRTVEAVRAAGYRRAVTTRWGSNPPGAPTMALRRCDIDIRRLRDRRGACSASLLSLRLSGMHPRVG